MQHTCCNSKKWLKSVYKIKTGVPHFWNTLSVSATSRRCTHEAAAAAAAATTSPLSGHRASEMRWQIVVVVYVLLLAYVVIGGVVFWTLESVKDRRDLMMRRPLTSPSEQPMTVDSIQRELISNLLQRLNSTPAQGQNRS